MANLRIHPDFDLDQKVALMQQDARFDVAEGDLADLNSLAAIRQGVVSRPALAKVPKVFLGNDCVFNCAYCVCRQSNECKRNYALTPWTLAEVAVRQAKQRGSGIFLSSAILRDPDYTQEMIVQTLRIIRQHFRYDAYVHAKVMPGADPRLIWETGRYADRLSVNIEVAQSEGYARVAKNKNRKNILTPMGQISDFILQATEEVRLGHPRFAVSQTTQLMAGSTREDDRTILRLTQALYHKYRLSRVYYTAFHYTQPARGYEDLEPVRTPVWRMARLYQADRLIHLYGFEAEELTPSSAPFLSERMDPKLAWALRNLERFPVEVNRADLETLLRVPGIGLTYAKRIVAARRQGILTHEALRSLGVSLKRSRHFLTCNGKYLGATCERPDVLADLLSEQYCQEQMDLAGC